MEKVKNESLVTPMLFPYEPEAFWEHMQQIIRIEIKALEKVNSKAPVQEPTSTNYKPLYKMNDVCSIFKVTRPTIYEWIRNGKLKPFKIQSRVYFLSNDINKLLSGSV